MKIAFPHIAASIRSALMFAMLAIVSPMAHAECLTYQNARARLSEHHVYENGPLKLQLNGYHFAKDEDGYANFRSTAPGFNKQVSFYGLPGNSGSKRIILSDTNLCPGVQLTAECAWDYNALSCEVSQF